MCILKNLSKPLLLIPIGGFIYYIIEILWRGYSHWTMFLVGGLCFYLIGLINEVLPWHMGLARQCLLASALVTLVELAAGYIINIRGGLSVWDYSHMPFNLFGQVCLWFSLLWVPLTAIAIVLDDWLRYWLYDEQRPRYTLF